MAKVNWLLRSGAIVTGEWIGVTKESQAVATRIQAAAGNTRPARTVTDATLTIQGQKVFLPLNGGHER